MMEMFTDRCGSRQYPHHRTAPISDQIAAKIGPGRISLPLLGDGDLCTDSHFGVSVEGCH